MLWAAQGDVSPIRVKAGGWGEYGVSSARAARDLIRSARRDGRLGRDADVTVTFAPGSYRFDGVVRLDGRDSGTCDHPVVWAAEKPGTVKIHGGSRLEAADFKPVVDAHVLSRLAPNARSKVRVCNVSSCLPQHLAPWPNDFRTPPAPWLYIDGRPAVCARWPNAGSENGGWARFTNAVDKGYDVPDRYSGSSGGKHPGAFEWNYAEKGAGWNFGVGVWAYGYWTHDWSENSIRLKGFEESPSNRVLRLSGIHPYGCGNGTWGAKERRFFVYNLLEELDAPGEWYLDREAGLLYVLPTENWEKAEIVLATSESPFFGLDGVSNVVFRGLSFGYSHTPEPSFDIADGRRISVEDCDFSCLAGSALSVSGECCRVTGCRAWNLGGSGVSVMGGDRGKLVRAGNVVERCDIHDYAMFRRTYEPAVRIAGCGQTVRDCRMHCAPHNALLYWGNEHLFESNEVYRVLLDTGDAGAFYTGRDASSLGNVIRGNHFHDLGGSPELSEYAMAIYFDDCDWGDSVIDNIFERAGQAVFIGGGNLHPVVGNLFIECPVGIHCDARGVVWRKDRNAFSPDESGLSWYERKFRAADADREIWDKRYPSVAGLLADRPDLPRMNPMTNNAFVACPKNLDLDDLSASVSNECPISGNAYYLTRDEAARDGVSLPPDPRFPETVDVLVVGGTAKGVSAATAAKAAGAERVYLLTPFPYLGEDLAGTLELGLPDGKHPASPLVRRLWSVTRGLAAYDYWPDRPTDGIRWIHMNDAWERISESALPPSPSDAVWYNGDVTYRCVLRKSSRISRIEVLTLDKTENGVKIATSSVSCKLKGGSRDGEALDLIRQDATRRIEGDYFRGHADAVSFVTDVDAEFDEAIICIRQDKCCDHQLVSRIWFHLADPEKAEEVPSPLKVKRIFDAELTESGVGFMTGTAIRRVFRDSAGSVRGVEVIDRSGRRTIRANRVIDATRYGILDRFGNLNVRDNETFSRIVCVDGLPPSAPGLSVEPIGKEFGIAHADMTGRTVRCTFALPMRDGTYPSFAAAEWRARGLTAARRTLDDADLLVWKGAECPDLESRIREGAELGRNAARARNDGMPIGGPTPSQLPLWGEYDVVVVGGGTSGTPAAIAAAESGAKTLLIEYANMLGGTGTDGMILGYYDGNHCGFTERFKKECLATGKYDGPYMRAETWRRMCTDAGVTVWLGAMGVDVTVEGGKVTEVEVATPLGCGRVRARCFIDGTGNADVAAKAGAPTEFLSGREFALQSAGQAPHRLGRDTINSDFGFVDDSSAWDLWLFGLRARAGAPDAWDIAKMPDSRERRRIRSDYAVTAQDVAGRRPFPDVIVQARSRQDSHGYLTDDYRFLSEPSAVMAPGPYGNGSHLQYEVNVPLRSLLPRGLSGLAVIGLGVGCARDVLPIIRMQADLMNMGYAAGVAAAMSAVNGGDFRRIDRTELKRRLVDLGILRRETLDWNADTDVSSDAVLTAAVRSMGNGYRGSHIVCRPENRARAIPLLREALQRASDVSSRQIYAKALGLFGDDAGVDTLVAIANGQEELVPFSGEGAFGRRGDDMDGVLIALGRTHSPKAMGPLLARLGKLTAASPVTDVRGTALAIDALGDAAAAPALAACLGQVGMSGWSVGDFRSLKPLGGYGLGPESDNCIRELTLARALWSCGDYKDTARKILMAYASDPRGVFSRYAKAVLAHPPRKRNACFVFGENAGPRKRAK